MTRYKNSIPFFNGKYVYFKKFFLPLTIIDWNNLDSNIGNSVRLTSFKKCISVFIRPSVNSAFHCHSPKGLKLFTRLSLRISHRRYHKFRYIFQETLNPIGNCGTAEVTISYLLKCPNFSNERLELLKKLQSIDDNIIRKNDSNIQICFSLVNTHLMI